MAVLEYSVTMDDVLMFQTELNELLSIKTVLELVVTVRMGKLLYSVAAHSYRSFPDADQTKIASGYAAYPTRLNKSFPGACLNALMQCQEHTTAALWLRTLQAQRGEA